MTEGGILVLDMSYTLDMIRQRQLMQTLEARTAGGFFRHVVSVHPLAGLFAAGGERYGRPVVTRVSDTQIFVEGRLGRWRALRWLPPVNLLAAQVSLIRLLLRLAPASAVTLVRIGDPYFLGLVGWVVARLLRVPLAIRVPFRYDEIRALTGRAVFPRLFRYGWVEKRIEQFVFPRCDLIAGANEDNMRYALENGGRAEVATVFRYGNLVHPAHWVEPAARPAAAAALRELGLQSGHFVVTVARLEPMKRVEDFIRVIAALRQHGRHIHGLIIGDGTQRGMLEALAASLEVGDAVVFAGNRNQEWIAAVLPHAAVVLSPHMGRALVEAALSAVPIVAFDYDWQREVVDVETGYLVANGDVGAMAARTEDLLTDPARARALGAGARAKVAAMMDPGSLIQHEQETYAALLRKWQSRSRRGAAAQAEGAPR